MVLLEINFREIIFLYNAARVYVWMANKLLTDRLSRQESNKINFSE